MGSLLSLKRNLRDLFQKEHLPNVILAGDFNLPSINWETYQTLPSPQYGYEVNQLVIDIVNEFSLTQIVKYPTRGRNILDLVFVTLPSLVNYTNVVSGVGDHDAVDVHFDFKAKVTVKKPRQVFVFGKADRPRLLSEISHLKDSFLVDFTNRTVNENWEFFTSSLNSILIKCIPQKIIKGRQGLPWLDNALRKKIRKKNKYHSLSKKAKSLKVRNQRWDTYLKLQQEVRTDIGNAYDKYVNSLFETDGLPGIRFW